jgi:hypothetical protein
MVESSGGTSDYWTQCLGHIVVANANALEWETLTCIIPASVLC